MSSQRNIVLSGAPSASVNRLLKEAGYVVSTTGTGVTLFVDDGSDHISVTGAAIDALRSMDVIVISHRSVLEHRILSSKLGVQHVLEPDELYLLENTIESVRNRAISIRFWGVRGSIPCPDPENMMFGGNTSCVQVTIRNSEDYLILDSGSGIRTLGNALVQHGREVHGHIFITHAHWDHIQGFPFFRPIYEPASSLAIHMPRQKLGGCKTVLTTQFTPTYFPVTVDMLNARIQYVTQESAPVAYDGYTMEFMMANHPVETAIYKFKHDGKIVVYAPDNELTPEFTPGFIEFIRDADVLIHDANYDRHIYRKRVGWGHSAWEDVVDAARTAGVKHLFLTHHDPTAHDEILMHREKQVHRHADDFETLALAREGMVVRI